MEPTELVSSRGKTLAGLAISLAFVVIALIVPRDGGDQTWRWLCLVFFGLCTAVFVVLLVRPQRITLDRDGFAVTGGLARTAMRRRWDEVERFRVVRMPRGGTVVGYDLAEHVRPDTYLGDLGRRWAADGVLPSTLRGSPDAIAARLNACREAALRR